MTLGKIIYIVCYRPIGAIKILLRQGLKASIDTKRGIRDMAACSLNLKETHLNNDTPRFLVYFLTGKRYWYQTAFCLYSLQKSTNKVQFDAVFVDDGSFDEHLIEQIKQQFPSSIVKTQAEINQNIDKFLPYSKYPLLNKKRERYRHIRKLTDVHVASQGWKLVLDSDMLFFKSPDQIIHWLIDADKPFFLQDPVNSYHYSLNLMQSLTTKTVRTNLNVGAVGLKSESIDWQTLENWIRILENTEGTSYYLEQALSAMIVAGQEIEIALPADYIVLPNESEATKPSAIMHHYVSESKQCYLQKSWKLIV